MKLSLTNLSNWSEIIFLETGLEIRSPDSRNNRKERDTRNSGGFRTESREERKTEGGGRF